MPGINRSFSARFSTLLRRLHLGRGAHITLVVLGFFVLWQAAVVLLAVPAFLLPPPTVILHEIWSAPIWYAAQAMHTVGATLLGFGFALVLGCIIAVFIVYSRVAENTIYPLIIALNNIPKIALAPLFIVWAGPGLASKIAIAFLIAVFSIIVNVVLGLRAVDPDAVDLFRSLRGNSMQTLLWLRMPNALPFMFAGAKVAIALSLVGTIAGEFVASQTGLGYVILAAQGVFDTIRAFAAIVILGVIGTILFYVLHGLERLACPWHVSQRSKSRMPTVEL